MELIECQTSMRGDSFDEEIIHALLDFIDISGSEDELLDSYTYSLYFFTPDSFPNNFNRCLESDILTTFT